MAHKLKTFEQFDQWVSTSTSKGDNSEVSTSTADIKPRSKKIEYVDRLLYKLGIKNEFKMTTDGPTWEFKYKKNKVIIYIKANSYYIRCESTDPKSNCPNFSGLDEYLLNSKLTRWFV